MRQNGSTGGACHSCCACLASQGSSSATADSVWPCQFLNPSSEALLLSKALPASVCKVKLMLQESHAQRPSFVFWVPHAGNALCFERLAGLRGRKTLDLSVDIILERCAKVKSAYFFSRSTAALLELHSRWNQAMQRAAQEPSTQLTSTGLFVLHMAGDPVISGVEMSSCQVAQTMTHWRRQRPSYHTISIIEA